MTADADAPFRCSVASLADDEPLAGTAPADARWLLVERPGAWTPKAADELALTGADGARVQLIRRAGGGATAGGRRVFRADVATGRSETALLADGPLDLEGADWRPHSAPLWLVCTHGRRDVCCAEFGRPVAAALAARWPEETWETSHLGGHRFAPTLVALPTGVTLGRVSAAAAVAAVEAIESGRLPDLGLVRGVAGASGAVQAAELALRTASGESRIGAVRLVEAVAVDDATRVTLADATGESTWRVTASATPRRQSCGEDRVKPAPAFAVELWAQ